MFFFGESELTHLKIETWPFLTISPVLSLLIIIFQLYTPLGNLIRTYKATDSCGNETGAEQYLSLQDTKGPYIYGAPEDVTVSKDAIPALPVVGAKDLGDDVIEVTVSETRAGETLIRTWKAVDKCGNKSEKSQRITLR